MDVSQLDPSIAALLDGSLADSESKDTVSFTKSLMTETPVPEKSKSNKIGRAHV